MKSVELTMMNSVKTFRRCWLHGFKKTKDTEAAISDLQIPEVNAQVICRQVSLTVTVDWDGVDMVGVSIRKHSSRAGFHHQVHGPEYWYLRRGARIVYVYFTEKIQQIVWSPYCLDFLWFYIPLVQRQAGYWISLTKFFMFLIFAVRGTKLSLLRMQTETLNCRFKRGRRLSLLNWGYIWKLLNKYRSVFPKVEDACDQGGKCAEKTNLNKPFSKQSLTCRTKAYNDYLRCSFDC